MKKTLGGDRLGAGKKMQVNLHGYERSTHDLGYIFRSTMSAGTLVPFMKILALPGDTFDIDLDCDIKTHPTIGPLFGSYKVQLDVFQAPIRLYQSLLHNNMLGIGLDMSRVKLPYLPLDTNETDYNANNNDITNSQINPSCILSYLGIRGIGLADPGTTRRFNGVPLLAYWEIYKQYYSNKQEKLGAVIHSGIPNVNTTIADPILIQVWGGTIANSYSYDVYQPGTPNTPAPMTKGTKIIIDYTPGGPTPLPETIMLFIPQHSPAAATQFAVPASEIFENWEDTGGNLLTGTIKPQYADIGYLITNWEYLSPWYATSVKPQVQTFPLDNLDEYRKAILAWSDEVNGFNMADLNEPVSFLFESKSTGIGNIDYWSRLQSQEGLAVKTYQSDIFNNWLDTTNMDYVSNVSAVSTAAGSFTIDQLLLSKKVYEMLNRIAVSGGTYDDWLDAVYAHDRYTRVESPIYHGGLIRELVFQEVVSNAATDTQDLGTLAGKGIMSQKRKGGKLIIRVDEPSYIIGIVSLTPRIDYSQGNDWDVHLKSIDDLHKPALDEIGFQDLICEDMAWWTTEWDGVKWVNKAAGKQPAWINYMTAYNKTFGNFAIQDNEMFMTLNRRYERDGTDIKDLTTYIDPTKFNYIFAETAIDAQNFWCQIGVDITARRKMSAKLMPNL